MTKLHYWIKVSKRGFNVMDLAQERKDNPKSGVTPHLEYVLALPYLYGAKTQVKRYQIAASTLEQNPSSSVISCIHEASTLFEDLCTVSKYITKCGNTHKLHKLWLDARNHIRHDTRDQRDDESESRKRDRADRAARLKIDPKLQMSLGFSMNLIKVGDIEIKISDIAEYLDWADDVIAKVMEEAKNKGQIK